MVGTPPWSYPDTNRIAGSPIPETVDVAIIGGGLTGLSAARSLAEADASVVLFETARIGAGATRHSLGVLAADYGDGPHDVMRRIGSGRATALWVAAAEAIEDIGGLIETSPVTISTTARHHEHLEQDAEWLKARGFPAAFPEGRGALETNGAVVAPLDLVMALGATIEARGGMLCEGVTVTSVSRHTGGYQVLSTEGKTTADAVIVAAGAVPTHVGVPRPEPAVRPADLYGVALRVANSASSPAHDVIRGHGLTIRKVSHDLFLAAGHRGLKPGDEPQKVAPTLLAMAMRLLGDGIDARIEHAWSTRIGLTADAVPHVWRDDGMWFGGGYNGDAIVPTMAVGSQLGDVLAGTRTQSIFAGIAPPRMRRSKGRVGAAIERRRRS